MRARSAAAAAAAMIVWLLAAAHTSGCPSPAGPDQQMVVRFEDINAAKVQAIANFAGVSVSSDRAACAIENAKMLCPVAQGPEPGVSANDVFCDANEHPNDLANTVWKVVSEEAKQFGYVPIDCQQPVPPEEAATKNTSVPSVIWNT